MKKRHKILLNILPAIIVLTLAHTAGAQKFIPCSGADCDFDDVYTVIDNFIDFVVKIMIPLAAVGFAIGGFVIMFSGGNEGRVSKGKNIMWAVLWGMLLILFAYLIVKTLIEVLA